MYLEFMDWDLWNLPYGSEESSFLSLPGWQYEFYSGYIFDVIEEDALDEKYCIQVLRILLAKADTEIDCLEQDLVSLQSELAWIENEDWPDICCAALTEKISCLEILVKSLVSKEKNDVEVQLLMHTQPVETMNEILKELIRNNLCMKDEQCKEVKDAIILNKIPDAPRQAINTMDENKNKGKSHSISFPRKGMKESSCTVEHPAVRNRLLELQERKTNVPETVKNNERASASLEDSDPHSFKVATGSSDGEILSGNSAPKNAGSGGGRQHGFGPEDQKLIQMSYSESVDKGRHGEKINIQPTNVRVSNSISDTDGDSSKTKTSSDSCSINVSGKIEENSSTSSAEVFLDSSMKPEVKKTDPGKKIKLAHASFKGLGLSAGRNATGDLNGMKNLSKSNSKVSGDEEYCSRATGKCKTLRLSLNPEGKQNHPREHEHADFIKNISAKFTSGISRRKGNASSRSSPCSNPDIKQKLCHFALKPARKLTIQESKVALCEKLISLNSSLKAEEEEKGRPLIMKVVETALNQTENCTLSSLLEPQDEKGKNTTKLQNKDEGKTMSKVHTSEIVADEKRSNLNSSKVKMKKSIKSNPPILQDVGISTMVVDSSSSFMSKVKKRKKSLVMALDATRDLVPPVECEFKHDGSSSDDSPKSVSQPQKKSKKTQFPIFGEDGDFSLQLDLSSSDMKTAESSDRDDLSVDWDSSSKAGLSLPYLILNKMRLADLRDMAKRYKLTKYYKLSKKAILQQLAGRIDDC